MCQHFLDALSDFVVVVDIKACAFVAYDDVVAHCTDYLVNAASWLRGDWLVVASS